MGVRAGARACVVGAPAGIEATLGLPELERPDAHGGPLDHAHLFVRARGALLAALPGLRDRLAPRGALWVSWPKAGGLGTDLALPEVIRIAYDHGLVESTCLSVDATWSALKLTHPKPGTTYRNGYGTLPDHTSP